ncbi:MAG: hypothetical protein HYU64_15705 [Armatimonadetes bacterium]|nr:hypothetical protein [Armatimonadota bacterium]
MIPLKASHGTEHGGNGGTERQKPAVVYFLPLIAALILIGAWLVISGYTSHKRAYQPPSTYVRPVAPSLVPETEKVNGKRTTPDLEHYKGTPGSDTNSGTRNVDMQNGKKSAVLEGREEAPQKEEEETPPERTEEGDPILVN